MTVENPHFHFGNVSLHQGEEPVVVFLVGGENVGHEMGHLVEVMTTFRVTPGASATRLST